MSRDFTHCLRELMQSVGFSSFKALSQAANVSERQLLRLRRGELAQVRVEVLLRLGQVLQVSVADLLAMLDGGQEAGVGSQTSGVKSQESRVGGQDLKLELTPTLREAESTESLCDQNAELHQSLSDLRQEYDRLQQQLGQQRQVLWQEFQQSSVQILESLLLQLPTAMYAAQQNPQAPAVKLLPLLRPLERLLEDWGIESIAPVGAEVTYDPQQHQLMAGAVQLGDRVKVRYTGYRQGDRLLYRAKVNPIEG